MVNFLEFIRNNSTFAKLSVDDLLFVEYKCPIKESKLPVWSDANYLVYVLGGRKVWSYHGGSYEIKEGEAIFVGKGAHYVEQILEKEFCVLIFFFPYSYLEDALEHARYVQKKQTGEASKLIPVHVNETLHVYFQSMASFFTQRQAPSKELLSLKFKELIFQLINYQGQCSSF